MEAAGWVLVLMFVWYYEAGQIVDRVRAIVPTHECHAARHAAEDYNNRFRWFWEEDDGREIRVLCVEHPGNRSA